MTRLKDSPDLFGKIANLPGKQVIGIIRNAMMEGKTISFIYEGKNKTVEAHAIGYSTKDGHLVLRGYQVAGNASRPLPLWALYRIEKIDMLSVDTVASAAPREGYTQGDRQMSSVLTELAL